MLARDALNSANACIAELKSLSSCPNRRTFGINTEEISPSRTCYLPSQIVGAVPVDETQRMNQLTRVCELLEATMVAYAKLISGDYSLDQFTQSASPLIEVENHYKDLVDSLVVAYEAAPHEILLRQVGSQFKTYGTVTNVSESNAVAEKLCELLSKRSDFHRDTSRSGLDQLNENIQETVERSTSIAMDHLSSDAVNPNLNEQFEATLTPSGGEPVNDKSTLRPEIRRKIDDLSQLVGSKELPSYLEKSYSQSDTGQRIAIDPNQQPARDAKLAESTTNPLSLTKLHENTEVAAVLGIVKSMLNRIKGFAVSNGQSEITSLSQEAREIVSCFEELAGSGDESDLRHYISELVNFGDPDITTLSPTNQGIAKQLDDIFKRSTQSDSAVVGLVKTIVEGVQNDALDGLTEKLRSTEVEKELSECLSRLLEGYANLRSKYVKAEQDKVALGQLVRSKHAESQAYHAQLQYFLSKSQPADMNIENQTEKLAAKLQRLQSHLLQVEENHTKEALAAEEREASLRDNLSRTEMQLGSLREFVESADEQITCAQKERDAAREACRACQSELSGLRASYANLQKALESLERDNQLETNVAAQHFRLENERLQKEVSTLEQRVKHLQEEFSRQEKLESTNNELQAQLRHHADRLAEAHALARRYEEQIQVLKSTLKEVKNELDGKLDKLVMKNLLISCLKLPPAKRPEAFCALGSVLDFTTEDFNLLGFNEPVAKNWKDLFWNSALPKQHETEPKESFVEMFAIFLEKESSPPNQLRLPTDYLKAHGVGTEVETASQITRRLEVSSASAVKQRLPLTSDAPLGPISSQRKQIKSKNPLLSGLSHVKPSSLE
uniref:GRIP domain-containing protein n=2 Tax=Mesocestoides corti TaxID=53468 RepID=A0A5K3FK12_MESCO